MAKILETYLIKVKVESGLLAAMQSKGFSEK